MNVLGETVNLRNTIQPISAATHATYNGGVYRENNVAIVLQYSYTSSFVLHDKAVER